LTANVTRFALHDWTGSFDGILFDVFPLTSTEVVDGECDSFYAEVGCDGDHIVFTVVFSRILISDCNPLQQFPDFADILATLSTSA
jgi:hypothetical protein